MHGSQLYVITLSFADSRGGRWPRRGLCALRLVRRRIVSSHRLRNCGGRSAWMVLLARSSCFKGEADTTPDHPPRKTDRLSGAMGLAIAVMVAAPAHAQTSPPDPKRGNLTLTCSFDVASAYMFRGIRQHSTGIALWPVADLGVAIYDGDGGLKSATANIGTWNSLKRRRFEGDRIDRERVQLLKEICRARHRFRPADAGVLRGQPRLRRRLRSAHEMTAFVGPGRSIRPR